MRYSAYGWAPLGTRIEHARCMTLKLCAMLMSVVLLPIGSVEASAAPAAVRNGATINCGAGRRAVIRRAVVNGQTVDRVQCVRASAVTVRRHGRSWKKSAAVIGGSTAVKAPRLVPRPAPGP